MSEAKFRNRARRLSALALETLGEIMRGGGADAARLAAAREVLDRAYGKCRATEPDGDPEGLTVVVRRFGEED